MLALLCMHLRLLCAALTALLKLLLEHHNGSSCNTEKLLLQAAEELISAGKPLSVHLYVNNSSNTCRAATAATPAELQESARSQVL
jgi:hypothetical protein